jgi:hypothetical protein
MDATTQRRRAGIALIQGGFYLATGIWPLVHLPSFEAVTGPKVDGWLVRTVGVIIAVCGAVLMLAGLRRNVGLEAELLGIGNAAGLAGIDIIYVARRRIAPIYLMDALAEILIIAGWALARRHSQVA